MTRHAGPYKYLLDVVGARARADVIAGTSAGGINGAALALSQANAQADISELRTVWAEQGRMESLLRKPYRGEPPSLLKGDECFLPELRDAFKRLASPFAQREPRHPIDLTVTTTLLRGIHTETVDDLGQKLSQTDHDVRFHFRHDPDDDTQGAFDPDILDQTVHRLALASRCTASFPVAFEPSFVPVAAPTNAADGDQEPDMADVASWTSRDATGALRNRSRYTVDGGVLVNTPTRAALAAVDQMAADDPVRRVLLLLHPHASSAMHEKPDVGGDRPPLTRTTASLLNAMSSQSGRAVFRRRD